MKPDPPKFFDCRVSHSMNACEDTYKKLGVNKVSKGLITCWESTVVRKSYRIVDKSPKATKMYVWYLVSWIASTNPAGHPQPL